MVDKQLIKELKINLKEHEQPNFIDPESGARKLLETCRSILVEADYKVLEPFDFSLNNINSHHDLITLFYGLMAAKNPDRIEATGNSHGKRNLKISSLFLKSRMTSGNINRKIALLECAEIIKTLVDNLDSMKLEQDTLNFSIFGQSNLGWITDKAISILNKNTVIKSELRADQLADEYMNNAERETRLGYDIEELNNILEGDSI